MNRVLYDPPYKKSGDYQNLVILAFHNHTNVRVFADTVLQHEFVIHKHTTRTVTVNTQLLPEEGGRQREARRLRGRVVLRQHERERQREHGYEFPATFLVAESADEQHQREHACHAP